MTEEEDPFPEWSNAATKGDVIQLAVRCLQMATSLVGATSHLVYENKPEAAKQLQEALHEIRKLTEYISALGGRNGGNE